MRNLKVYSKLGIMGVFVDWATAQGASEKVLGEAVQSFAQFLENREKQQQNLCGTARKTQKTGREP